MVVSTALDAVLLSTIGYSRFARLCVIKPVLDQIAYREPAMGVQANNLGDCNNRLAVPGQKVTAEIGHPNR